ncbi:MAG: DNA-processing protein DprA [Brevinematales bacterium]|nr:DNA-processing protein DprA [Brevinematales bacterium]
MKREEILLLNLLGFGFKRYSYIKSNFGSIFDIPTSSYNEVSKILKINTSILKDLRNGLFQKKIEEIDKLLNKYSVDYITIEDSNYPYRLNSLNNRPIIIYYKGNKELLKSSINCSIVGTRRNDELGKLYTRNIVDLLVNNNVVIISGLARGIDIIAHRRTIEKGGQTIAVLGGGLDHIYPPEHKKEFFEISEKGCLISEYPPGVPPLKRNFFARNRIISGLSDVVVVVQAPENSGALITAEYALKQNKSLFAIPGNIENYLHKGCNLIIKKGAKLLLDYKEILEELGYKSTTEIISKNINQTLSEDEKYIYSLITKEISLDEIAELSGMSVNKIYPLLLSLEVKGLIVQNLGGTFSRVMC